MTDEQANLIASRLDDVARLLALQYTRQFETAAEVAVAMSDAGFEPTRIAELTGVKAGTVRKSIQRAKKK